MSVYQRDVGSREVALTGTIPGLVQTQVVGASVVIAAIVGEEVGLG